MAAQAVETEADDAASRSDAKQRARARAGIRAAPDEKTRKPKRKTKH